LTSSTIWTRRSLYPLGKQWAGTGNLRQVELALRLHQVLSDAGLPTPQMWICAPIGCDPEWRGWEPSGITCRPCACPSEGGGAGRRRSAGWNRNNAPRLATLSVPSRRAARSCRLGVSSIWRSVRCQTESAAEFGQMARCFSRHVTRAGEQRQA
jgi:hypothetical protein